MDPAHEGGLVAHRARTVAGPGAVADAAVKGYAEEGDVDVGGEEGRVGDDGAAHCVARCVCVGG